MLQYLAEDSSQKGCEALFSGGLVLFRSGVGQNDSLSSARRVIYLAAVNLAVY